MSQQLRTLKGGPLDGVKLHLSDPLAPALRYLCVAVDSQGVAVFAPEAVYTLRHVQQKTRVIRRYEYSMEWNEWRATAQHRRLEREKHELRDALGTLYKRGL